MRMEPVSFTALRIHDAHALDPITVLLRDVPMPPPTRAGHVVVECYGKAWSAYFGSMGDTTLVKFLSRDPEYLAGKLAHGRETKSERAYLLRIAQAVAAACANLADGLPLPPTPQPGDGEVGR